MPKPKLPRKPRPLCMPGVPSAFVVTDAPSGEPQVCLNVYMHQRPLPLPDVANAAAWFAEAHAYISAFEARKEADRG